MTSFDCCGSDKRCDWWQNWHNWCLDLEHTKQICRG